jgi:hypothetical protein
MREDEDYGVITALESCDDLRMSHARFRWYVSLCALVSQPRMWKKVIEADTDGHFALGGARQRRG